MIATYIDDYSTAVADTVVVDNSPVTGATGLLQATTRLDVAGQLSATSIRVGGTKFGGSLFLNTSYSRVIADTLEITSLGSLGGDGTVIASVLNAGAIDVSYALSLELDGSLAGSGRVEIGTYREYVPGAGRSVRRHADFG